MRVNDTVLRVNVALHWELRFWKLNSSTIVIGTTSPDARTMRVWVSDYPLPKPYVSPLDLYQVGVKLRALRMGKQLTLSRLATESGFSTALLSKLECGQMIPTLPTLSKICGVYGVSLSYFFSDPSGHSVSITRRGHLAAARGLQESVRRVPLHYDHIGSARCGASLLEFPAGLKATASEPGQRFSGLVYVIDGGLVLDIGEQQEVLGTGDCACIDTDMVVVWGSAHKDVCRVLLMKV